MSDPSKPVQSSRSTTAIAQPSPPDLKSTSPANAPHVLGVEPQEQTGNGCGTTSLAMALSKVTSRPFTQAMVSAEINLTDIYTSASNMRSFANKQGIAGRLVNNLSDKEVIEAIDKGRPIVFLTDLTPDDPHDVATMHWRVIDGYQWVGQSLQLHIADPWGTTYWRSWDELGKEWNDIKAIGLDTGYNRFGLILGANANDRALGADRKDGIFATEGVVDASSDVVNDGAQVAHGRVWDLFHAVWDGLRTIGSALLYPFQLLSGGVDHSAGKTAVPPPVAQNKGLRRPRVSHKAQRVVWWDGGEKRLDRGRVLVQAPVPNGAAGLKPPTV